MRTEAEYLEIATQLRRERLEAEEQSRVNGGHLRRRGCGWENWLSAIRPRPVRRLSVSLPEVPSLPGNVRYSYLSGLS